MAVGEKAAPAAAAQSALRNFGIFAHIDAGKTSLTERILYLAGRVRNPGSVDAGTTATDYLEVERKRGITVKAACVRFGWRGLTMNLIDTPGHVDFGSEVERSLRVLDGAVVALCAVAGVQSRTETIVRHCIERRIPLIAYVNKMDRRGASFERALAEFRALDARAAAIALPVGEGPDFAGIIDLVALKAKMLSADSSRPSAWEAIPASLMEKALKARGELVEALANCDETVLADFVAGREPAETELRAALRRAVLSAALVPVLCGTAFSDETVASLLDAVADYLPAPEEAPCPPGINAEGREERRRGQSGEAFSGLVFKTEMDEAAGRLSWTRLWSGRLAPGDRLIEAGSNALLRVQKIFAIEADRLEEEKGAAAGEIVALALVRSGGKNRAVQSSQSLSRQPGSTGSSLSAPGSALLYEPIVFPEPVVSFALEPVSQADQAELEAAAALLVEDDPSLQLRKDGETGRTILAGMGELHLEVAVERLREERGIRIRTGAPQISCRERLLGSAETSINFERDLNGERVKASLSLSLGPARREGGAGSAAAGAAAAPGAPLRLGGGLDFETAAGLKLAPAFRDAIIRGIESSISAGPAGAWPVEACAARVLGLEAPASKQAELALEISASLAARACLEKAGTKVVEPWMRIELQVSEDRLGPALAVLTGRRGRVESIDDTGGDKLVTAAAPLRLIFGLAGELRSATEGRATYQARFLRFEPLAQA